MKPIDVNPTTYIDFGIETHGKYLNLKLVIMQEYLNIKTLLQKSTP